MPALLIRHKVEDYAAWRAGFENEAIARRAHGSLGSRCFMRAGVPDEIFILLEWDDLDRARLFIASDDFRDAMMAAGITDEPDIWLLETTSQLDI